ncbi:FadR/GntR family transcriptional regulator [uncultured Desulfuromusa sp.]|uniref:FadR/GntR family transcriptional regulator n=1 Tax=uncultured Desulfuromusa sp. TaxID=219183 RepID=UPI002AA961C7|nr:FadR/GntR family transcriptional regulator [uncultured Desulfuromusa sp.]
MTIESKKRLKRHPTLSDEVAKSISDAIRDRKYQPGERLPNENSLCEMYGVSRPVLREAISMLKYEGLLIPQQGRGVFVSDKGHIPSLRMEAPDFRNKQQVLQILELLLAVEVYYTGLAAEHRSEEQLQAIKKALDELTEAISKGEVGSEEDLVFHREIVKATNNPYFEAIAHFFEENMRHAIRTARKHSSQFKIFDMDVIKEHQSIFKAIEEKNVEKAHEAAENHLKNAAIRLTSWENLHR